MIEEYKELRDKMVEEQLIGRGITSDSILDAMRTIPRHLFVPEHLSGSAYDDSPLPIDLGQTISQPYIVAFMTEQLGVFPGMKVLEIGTGSGYQTAVLAHLGCEVYTIEVLENLLVRAKEVFAALNLDNIKARHCNGFAGWTEKAPFDAIIVTAAPDSIPEKLIEQLKNGGKMIIPVGGVYSVQSLKLIVKESGKLVEEDLLPVRFVPMVEREELA